MRREDEVRLIAYKIWEEEGYPDGKHAEHWFRSEVIWEERQKPKTSAESSKSEAKPEVKPTAKVALTKKKSRQ